ncbi:hypothetical protein [Actinosynnema pretiosum]|uniref:SPOR domain-containing protein n=1 Tax=Actinosynnema pretiosum TaxID=42197 RepID=A0A290Z0S3_9PSEU|nr:hypothetical protein [Actinosynnema pretiosum]ATE52620.1 hypothetical protein CNX65_04410 [Actinosynnema pretiosum]
MADPDGWYYCLTHRTSEQGLGCRGADRMGPYPDRATADRALEIARQRTENADAADEAEDEWKNG